MGVKRNGDGHVGQVLTAEEYKSWLRVQEAAETALDDRDKKLYDAACMIETNLELLGEIAQPVYQAVLQTD